MTHCFAFSVRGTILIEPRMVSRMQVPLHCDTLLCIVKPTIQKTAMRTVGMTRFAHDKKSGNINFILWNLKIFKFILVLKVYKIATLGPRWKLTWMAEMTVRGFPCFCQLWRFPPALLSYVNKSKAFTTFQVYHIVITTNIHVKRTTTQFAGGGGDLSWRNSKVEAMHAVPYSRLSTVHCQLKSNNEFDTAVVHRLNTV